MSRKQTNKITMSLPAVTGSQGGAGLVGEPFHLLQWEEPGTQTTGPPDRIRRLTDRVGSVLPVHPDRSSLVSSRKEDAHQLPRAPGSNPGSKDLSKSQVDKRLLLLLDNQTAVATWVGQCSPRQPSYPGTYGCGVWRDIFLTAQHLLGVENIRANRESRVMKDRSDWMPNPEIFHQIYFSQPEVYLFATCLSFQLPCFFSWPLAEVTDAFVQDWSLVNGYANSPWNRIGRVLAKVEQQKAGLILVVPIWPSQPWYLSLLVADPLRIDPQGRVIERTCTWSRS